jgi:hypothetical protein
LIIHINQLFNFSFCYSASLKAEERECAVFRYKTDEFVEAGLTSMHETKMYLKEANYKHAVLETAILN